MKASRIKRKRRSEQGIALVIAIFTLMLISVVATALILMAGTATSIRANYKSSMQAFYDAKAGLEEGRSRLWVGSQNPLSNCLFPTPNNPMPMGQVCYIVNPDQTTGETVDPTNASSKYYDSEYASEGFPGPPNFGAPFASNSPIPSLGIGGASFKWVRVTPTTERSSHIDVNGDGQFDASLPLYHCADASDWTHCPDGPHQFVWNGVGAPSNASQVLTVTALAMTPSGGFSGRRLLQYTVAADPNPLGRMLAEGGPPPPMNQIFPAALTLNGNGVSFAPGPGNYIINGNDMDSPGGVAAIGFTNSNDSNTISNAAKPVSKYQSPNGIPALDLVTMPELMRSPAGLDTLVNNITGIATVIITPPQGTVADQTSLPSGMSATNPVIAVVNGDFHLSHPNGGAAFTGYGLLLVTGTFYYDPDDSWNGVILVIGKGVFDGAQYGSKGGVIDGAVLVANTRDRSTGALLSTLGPASYNSTGGGGGILYSSNWVGKIQSMVPYKVLSFREIQQQ